MHIQSKGKHQKMLNRTLSQEKKQILCFIFQQVTSSKACLVSFDLLESVLALLSDGAGITATGGLTEEAKTQLMTLQYLFFFFQ